MKKSRAQTDLSLSERNAESLGDRHARLCSRLERGRDHVTRKVQQLAKFTRNQDLVVAHAFVTKSADKFKGTVLGPIGAHVSVGDALAAKYLGNAVGLHMWLRFIVTCEEDEKLLLAELDNRLAGDWRPDISIVPDDEGDAEIPHPLGEARALASQGVLGTLDELLSAPPRVVALLCDIAALNRIYGFRRDKDLDHARQLADAHPALKQATLYTPAECLRWVRSRYSDDESATVRGLVEHHGKWLLGTGGGRDDEALADDRREERALAEELRQARADVAAAVEKARAANREFADLTRDIEELEERQKDQANAQLDRQTQLRERREKLKFHNLRGDPMSKRGELEQRVAAERAKAVRAAQRLGELAPEAARLQAEADTASMRLAVMDRHMKAEIEDNQEAFKAYKKKLTHFEKARLINEDDRKAAEAAWRELSKNAPKSYSLEMTDEEIEADEDVRAWMRALRRLPGGQNGEDRGAVEDALEETREAIASVRVNNPAAEKVFNECQKNIQSRTETLGELKEKSHTNAREIQQTHENWFPKLREVTERINATFSSDFATIGVAGEVALVESDPPGEYDKYTLEIRVKFRDAEPLHVLHEKRQSGGERSVSTIAFLVALQGVTRTPFRVVDEINQGMDPVNERKIYRLLVRSASEEGTPQCFLLTPKLLSNLPYTPVVNILNIQNGSQIHGLCRPGMPVDWSGFYSRGSGVPVASAARQVQAAGD